MKTVLPAIVASILLAACKESAEVALPDSSSRCLLITFAEPKEIGFLSVENADPWTPGLVACARRFETDERAGGVVTHDMVSYTLANPEKRRPAHPGPTAQTSLLSLGIDSPIREADLHRSISAGGVHAIGFSAPRRVSAILAITDASGTRLIAGETLIVAEMENSVRFKLASPANLPVREPPEATGLFAPDLNLTFIRHLPDATNPEVRSLTWQELARERKKEKGK